MLSMTGYGKCEYNKEGLALLVEVKTINNRNLDINLKTPRSFICFEDMIRKCVQQKIGRGRVDLFLTFIDSRETEINFTLDSGVVKAYYKVGEEIAKTLNIPNDLTVSNLIRMQDVVKEDTRFTDVSEFEEVIKETVLSALDSLNEMREREGEKLKEDMLSRLETIKELVAKVEERAPLVAVDYKEKLKERIAESLADVKYDEVRLLNEVAYFTDKSNIDEEITRLKSHIRQFTDICNLDLSGKKLDFLLQEFNRESNTICSKANDIIVTQCGLALKNEIEKIREQVQNVE
ncbi:MAG: YicC family protein [Clostridiales bacterium]|nr:YicC family protein [Clostridiales bacterium]